MRSLRDRQRSRVYAAEDVLISHNRTELLTASYLKRRQDDIIEYATYRGGSPLWDLEALKRTKTRLKPPAFTTGATAYPFTFEITFGNRCTDLIIYHEFAHIITPRLQPLVEAKAYEPHGLEFCTVYLELVARFLGAETYEKLVHQFDLHKVRYAVPQCLKEGLPNVP